MVPPLLFDISHIDLNQVQIEGERLEQINPQRGDMRMLDGVFWYDPETVCAVAFKDVRDDEFWVPGHIPGRPLFPGVLMIEAGAQLASFMVLSYTKQKFLGFAGCEKVKFRGQVVPGDRLLLLGSKIQFKPRRAICAIQGLVKGKLVFEATVIGMPM